MRGLIGALRTVVVGATIALVPIVAPAAGTPAGASNCSTAQVTVVVDLSAFGQGVHVGCASSPSSGWDALIGAGFSPSPVPKYGTNFVCRIDGWPQNISCANTPPATAYWAYWEAGSTNSPWAYAAVGAGATHPGPGSVEGWAFGARAAPSISPAQAAPSPSPPPPPPPSSSPPPPSSPNPPAATNAPTPALGGGSNRVAPAGGTATGAGSPTGAPSNLVAGGSASVGAVGGGATSSTGTGASPAATAKGSARTNASGTRNAGRTNGATTAPGGTRAGSGEQSGAPGSTTSGTSSNGSPIVNQASSPIRIREQSGSPWPLFLTIAILGGLTLAAVLIARRRRGRAQT